MGERVSEWQHISLLHHCRSAGYTNTGLISEHLNLTDPRRRNSLSHDWQTNLSPVNSNTIHHVGAVYLLRAGLQQ